MAQQKHLATSISICKSCEELPSKSRMLVVLRNTEFASAACECINIQVNAGDLHRTHYG